MTAGAAMAVQGDPGEVPRAAMTGRRARRAREEPTIEALVTTTSQGRRVVRDRLGLGWRPIALLCEELVSVAEISARLAIPLGVARVLVADMAEVGLVAVHQRNHDEPNGTELILLERILSGLRSL